MKKKIIKKYNKLLCYLFGHKLKFNFPVSSMPSRCICSRCRIKGELDYRTLEFSDVNEFSTYVGTDEELIKRWFQG